MSHTDSDLLQPPGALQEEANEIARTTRRQMYVVLFTGFFLMLTLAGPDAQLVRADGTISWPLIHTQVQLSTFLFYAPFALVGLHLYLLLFVERMAELERQGARAPGIFIFTMANPLARILSELIFYAFVPVVLIYFCWRAMAREEAGLLAGLTAAVTLGSAFLLYRRERRSSEPGRRRAARFLLQGVSAVLVVGATVVLVAGRDPFLKMRELDLERADLGTSEEYPYVNIVEADLRYAKAQGATLIGADMRRVRLDHADLSLSRIGTPEDEAIDPGGPITDLSHASLEGIWIQDSDLRNVRFECANLTDADMRQVEIEAADFDSAILRGVKLTRANEKAKKKHEREKDAAPEPQVALGREDIGSAVDAEDASGSTAPWAGVIFQDADMRGADLRQAWLPDANFRGADLQGADFFAADLTEARFNRANLSKADLHEANLTGATFRGADLTGASLKGVEGLDDKNLLGARLCDTTMPDGTVSDASCDRPPVDASETACIDRIR